MRTSLHNAFADAAVAVLHPDDEHHRRAHSPRHLMITDELTLNLELVVQRAAPALRVVWYGILMPKAGRVDRSYRTLRGLPVALSIVSVALALRLKDRP